MRLSVLTSAIRPSAGRSLGSTLRGAVPLLVTALALASAPHALAVIAGDGAANTDGTGIAGFSYVGQLNGSSAVYLGDGWVISAHHVAGDTGAAVTLNGVTYQAVAGSGVRISNGGTPVDLTVFRIQPAATGLPDLAPVSMPSSLVTVGTATTLVGFGYWSGTRSYWDSTTNPWTELPSATGANQAGYLYDSLGTRRWGHDAISGTTSTTVDGTSTCFTMNFTAGSGLTTAYPNEASLANGDSGGGLFLANGQLVGILEAKGTGSLVNQPANTAVFGDISYAVSMVSYRLQTLQAIGAAEWTTGGGSWNSSSNWLGGVPSGAGLRANFLQNATAGGTVSINAAVTVGGLSFNTPAAYTLSGSGSLTLNNSGTGASITAYQGNQIIAMPPTLADDLTLGARPGASLTLSAGLLNAASHTLTIAGGPVTIAGPQTHGANTAMNVYGATLTLNSDPGRAAGPDGIYGNADDTFTRTVSLTVGHPTDSTRTATATFTSSQHLAGLTVNNGSTATVASSGSNLLVTSALAVGSAGKLDMTNNDLVVHVPAGQDVNAAYSSALTSLSAGANGGLWTGTSGITSSAAAGSNLLRGLGLVKNADLIAAGAGMSTFDGEPVDDHAILLKYTYMGDTNLDGVVDNSDYASIDAAYNYNLAHPDTPETGWLNGDFNYDGKIDAQDYFLIDSAYYATHPFATATPSTVFITAAPEPASLVLLVMGVPALLCRRRRR